jgi:hypothetical protein
VVRAGVARAYIDLTARIAPLGLLHTRKNIWTRRLEHTLQFVHLHRGGISYGAPLDYSVSFRVHLGIRVLNHAFPGIALNGPSSDDARDWAARYHLRFNAKTGSTYDRCLDDLTRFISEDGQAWFAQFPTEEALLQATATPLSAAEVERLGDALAGRADPDVVSASLQAFGVRRARRVR